MQGSALQGHSGDASASLSSSWAHPSSSCFMPSPLLRSLTKPMLEGEPQGAGYPKAGGAIGTMRSAVGHGRCLAWLGHGSEKRRGSILYSASTGRTQREGQRPLGILIHSLSSNLGAGPEVQAGYWVAAAP